MDDTTFLIIIIVLLSSVLEPPYVRRFRENREREQRKPEKYRFT